ncbi:hypothetical protein ACLOJK_039400 [Asimina triloba]
MDVVSVDQVGPAGIPAARDPTTAMNGNASMPTATVGRDSEKDLSVNFSGKTGPVGKCSLQSSKPQDSRHFYSRKRKIKGETRKYSFSLLLLCLSHFSGADFASEAHQSIFCAFVSLHGFENGSRWLEGLENPLCLSWLNEIEEEEKSLTEASSPGNGLFFFALEASVLDCSSLTVRWKLGVRWTLFGIFSGNLWACGCPWSRSGIEIFGAQIRDYLSGRRIVSLFPKGYDNSINDSLFMRPEIRMSMVSRLKIGWFADLAAGIEHGAFGVGESSTRSAVIHSHSRCGNCLGLARQLSVMPLKTIVLMWTVPEAKDPIRINGTEDEKMKLIADGCNMKIVSTLSFIHGDNPILQKAVKRDPKDILGEVSKTHYAIQTLDKTISNLEMELSAARAAQESILNGSPVSESLKVAESTGRRKYLMVVGINTAFSSRKRRDSVRATWLLQGEKRKRLEEEKGIIVRFVIGHSATPGGILDKAIEAEDRKHGDFMRLEHVEGYLELSAKTKTFFATAVSMWDADFYVKVDDDVHVNIATLGTTLARHRSKPRVYIGCMKSGPVLAQKGVRYHEPEYWKFGEAGNKYFRHATGQLYAISRDLASYISINQFSILLHLSASSRSSPQTTNCTGVSTITGRPKLATSVLPHLTGPAVAFANPLKGSKRSTSGAVKERMHFGVQPSEEGKAGNIERTGYWSRDDLFHFISREERYPRKQKGKEDSSITRIACPPARGPFF